MRWPPYLSPEDYERLPDKEKLVYLSLLVRALKGQPAPGHQVERPKEGPLEAELPAEEPRDDAAT